MAGRACSLVSRSAESTGCSVVCTQVRLQTQDFLWVIQNAPAAWPAGRLRAYSGVCAEAPQLKTTASYSCFTRKPERACSLASKPAEGAAYNGVCAEAGLPLVVLPGPGAAQSPLRWPPPPPPTTGCCRPSPAPPAPAPPPLQWPPGWRGGWRRGSARGESTSLPLRARSPLDVKGPH